MKYLTLSALAFLKLTAALPVTDSELYDEECLDEVPLDIDAGYQYEAAIVVKDLEAFENPQDQYEEEECEDEITTELPDTPAPQTNDDEDPPCYDENGPGEFEDNFPDYSNLEDLADENEFDDLFNEAASAFVEDDVFISAEQDEIVEEDCEY